MSAVKSTREMKFQNTFLLWFFWHLLQVFPRSYPWTRNFSDTEHSLLAVLGRAVFRQTSWLAWSPRFRAVFSRAAPKGLCERECAYQHVPERLHTSCVHSWISRGSVCSYFRLHGIRSIQPQGFI